MKGPAMHLSAFRTLFGRRPRTVRRLATSLRLTSLEDRTTPSTLQVSPDFTPGGNRYNTIQSAVDAASPGDNIMVHPGTYVEAVLITTSNIDLMAAGPADQVKIQAPAGADITVHVDGGATGVDIKGFTVIGGNAGIQFGDHFDSPPSASGSGAATHNVVTGYAQVGVEAIGHGTQVEVDHDTIQGPGVAGEANAPIGVQISDGAMGEIDHNTVTANLGNSNNEGVGILVFETSNVEVDHNSVSTADEGILLFSFQGDPRVTNVEVDHNQSFNNTFNGIGLLNADNNRIDHNDTNSNGFDGINVGSDPNDPNAPQGSDTGNLFDYNSAQQNGRAGIFMESTATGNTLDHNQLLNNNTNHLPNGADAVDLSQGNGTAGTANSWSKDKIGTSIPAGLQ
jgi:parallel beta-helix repeat protein